MDYTISNNLLTVSVRSKGAELFSVFNSASGLEYMWSADPKFWAKTSPVLFPIVGTLKENTYHYQGKAYHLSRHGFARDLEFQLTDQQKDRFTFLLTSSEETFPRYPFRFELRIAYRVEADFLYVTYEVKNPGEKEMLFSLGAHPAFKVPLNGSLQYDDYFLAFNEIENAGRWPISKEGLILREPEPVLENEKQLNLTRPLFSRDALVFKHLRSSMISLRSAKDSHGLDFYIEGFPYLGIWAQPGADFVCIEPWCGIADTVDHHQEFSGKEGIEKLAADGVWTKSWKVKFF